MVPAGEKAGKEHGRDVSQEVWKQCGCYLWFLPVLSKDTKATVVDEPNSQKSKVDSPMYT